MREDDLALWQRLRALAVAIRLGPRAGTNPRLQGMLRFLNLRGTQAGQRSEGRLKDYLFVLSALKDRNVFRRREIAPLRRVHMVVDVRDLGESGGRRLLQATEFIGGVLLAMQGCRLSFTVWGERSLYPTQALSGEGQWPFLRRLVAAMDNLVSDPAASAGALQRAAATDEPAHLVMVTPWVEPENLRFLPTPFGGTCFLVGTRRSWLSRSAVGVTDPILVVQPPDAAEARDEDRVARLNHVCRQRRIELVQLSGRHGVLEELEDALGNPLGRVATDSSRR
jgi:hypothetical protein